MYSDYTSERPFSTLTIAILLVLALPCWLMYECGTSVGLIEEDEQPTTAPASPSDPTVSEEPDTFCGHTYAKIYYSMRSEWGDYTCMARNESANWSECLPRSEYTDEVGKGCPGAERCCLQ